MNRGNQRSIVFVVSSGQTAQAFLGGYFEKARSAGWKVSLVCSPFENNKKFASDKSVNLYELPITRSPSPIKDLSTIFSLCRILISVRPDVVLYATPKASFLAAIAAAVSGVKSRMHLLWGLRLETISSYMKFVFWMTEWITMKLSTSVIANSHSLALKTSRLGLGPKVGIEVLGSGSSHGVDTLRFSRNAFVPELSAELRNFLNRTSGLTISYVGRLHPDKGIEFLIESLKIAAAKGISLRLLIIGGEDGLGIENLNYSINKVFPVHFAGQVSDIRPYLSVTDVLCLMSLREGFPNIIIEAASMQIPAIVSDATGVIDSVEHDVTGLVVRNFDITEFVDSVSRLARDDELIRRLGINARRRAVDLFEQEKVLALFERRIWTEFR